LVRIQVGAPELLVAKTPAKAGAPLRLKAYNLPTHFSPALFSFRGKICAGTEVHLFLFFSAQHNKKPYGRILSRKLLRIRLPQAVRISMYERRHLVDTLSVEVHHEASFIRAFVFASFSLEPGTIEDSAIEGSGGINTTPATNLAVLAPFFFFLTEDFISLRANCVSEAA
jgi:hypothetical protein